MSPKELQKYEDWMKTKKGTLPQTAIGGAFTVCFTPTGIGTFVTATCVDGTTINLTDYDDF